MWEIREMRRVAVKEARENKVWAGGEVAGNVGRVSTRSRGSLGREGRGSDGTGSRVNEAK